MLPAFMILDLKLKQLYVATTFLHDNLEEQIFMKQLEELIKSDFKNEIFLLRNHFLMIMSCP